MPKFYRIFLLIFIVLIAKTTSAQIEKDTVPSSINVDLENIFNAKTPQQYTIAAIKVISLTLFYTDEFKIW